MKCLHCLSDSTKVINSRETAEGAEVWRRRSCQECKRVFTTTERAQADSFFVVKRNGSRQRFMPEKLLISIFKAIDGRKFDDNGDNAKNAKTITDRVIQTLLTDPDIEKDVTTKKIIVLTYLALLQSDDTHADAYAAYAPYRLSVLGDAGIME